MGKDIFYKIFGVILIIIGIIFYVTPIPGTTLLIILGLIWLVGKRRTLYFLKEILGNKIFRRFRIKKVVDKI